MSAKPIAFNEAKKWKSESSKFGFEFSRCDANDRNLIHGFIIHYNDENHSDEVSRKPASFIRATTGTFDQINVSSGINGAQLPLMLLLKRIQNSPKGECIGTELLSGSLAGFINDHTLEAYCEDGFMKSDCLDVMRSLVMIYHELVYSKKFYAKIDVSNIYMVENGSGSVNLRFLEVREVPTGQRFKEKQKLMEKELLVLLEKFKPAENSFLRKEYDSFVKQDLSRAAILFDPFLQSPEDKYELPMKYYENSTMDRFNYSESASFFVGRFPVETLQFQTPSSWIQKVDEDPDLKLVKDGRDANGALYATYTDKFLDLLRFLRNFVSHSRQYSNLQQLTLRAIVKKFYENFGDLYILTIHKCSKVDVSQLR